MVNNLDVMLWGQKAGTLVTYQDRHDEKICFYFDSGFVKGNYDIAPLQAPISGVAAKRGLPVYPEKEKLFCGLPSFIADSLPDNWGNRVFERWAKENNIAMRNISSLDRLAYIGRRGMGALEFVPPIADEMDSPFKVEISDLYRMAQQTLDEAFSFKADINPNLMIESLFKVGTSAGGRSPKAIINVNQSTGECYSGQVASPKECFTPMIIKFDEHGDVPTTRIEYSFYLMAMEVGLKMKPSQLIEGNGVAHFLTERFDRSGNNKIHTQTLAAMRPLADSYEDLFDTACRIAVSPVELRQLFLEMTMNVVCGNVDDHSKNFSFMMAQDGVWHVAPAYDFTFTVDPSAPAYINRHSLTVNYKNHDISRNDLLAVARQYSIKSAEAIIDNAIAVAGRYNEFAKAADIDSEWIEKINKEIEHRIAML